jgi:hypothetical protein
VGPWSKAVNEHELLERTFKSVASKIESKPDINLKTRAVLKIDIFSLLPSDLDHCSIQYMFCLV